ncbi:DUF1656 domain-containing protein [Belnapia sp. T6]|uniref:DUF1656 domain-containing protein n=1 Tax=Belnapia mucosa TaxID=2804532 RepID=A0ABS1V3K1_9PROT|nr:DUF1656 domain-containing protein [Belnapia mucosa]MBL6456162.1 DUF1656 domain-containing protein [Belnapia mucosa]
MIAEIDIFGIFVPALLVWVLIALLLKGLVWRLAGRLGLPRHVWHPPLFEAALFLLLLGGVVAVAHWIAP